MEEALTRRRTVAELLEAARSGMHRLEPPEASRAMSDGALVIDTRCADALAEDRVIPGSIHVPLSVLYWRLDATSGHADARLSDTERQVILICAHGYSSSLAAATLRERGSRGRPTSSAASRPGRRRACRSQLRHEDRCSSSTTRRTAPNARTTACVSRPPSRSSTGTEVRVFLMADAVGCAKPGQTTPDGYYNIGRMIRGLAGRGVVIGCCGSCLDARGYGEADFAEGTTRSSMRELAEWTVWADKVIVF